MSFVFYDTETTGTNAAFDQILQFAAIHTDADLNELGHFEIRSRLLPYVLPSPGALRVTGLTLEDLLNEAHPSHYEMVSAIRRTLADVSPTLFIGYNGLRFDEEFLRQAFYQCLHPPYLTNTGGSRRADGLHLVRAAAFLHPDAIAPAFNDEGGASLRLDRLAPANGFGPFEAHDALADVEALVHLCRRVRDRCPALWSRFQRLAGKSAVEDFLRREPAFLLLEFYPTATGSFVATAIGSNNANIVYAYDLSVDPDALRVLGEADLAARLAERPRLIRRIRKNAAPTLCPLSEAPRERLGGVSPEAYVERARALRADRPLLDRLTRIAEQGGAAYPTSLYVERQLYDGFWSDADASRLEAFHRATWPERAAIAERLDDPRLRWLARRLIFVEQPHWLAPEQHAAFAAEIARRHLASPDECGGWTTLGAADEELTAILADIEVTAAAPFQRLGAYFAARRAQAEACLHPAPAPTTALRGG